MPNDDFGRAHNLEQLAQNRMDVSDGLQQNIALASEWSKMSPAERNGVAMALVQNAKQFESEGLPSAAVHYDANQNCDRIDFTTQFRISDLFSHSKPRHVKVANDGDVAIWVSAD